MAASPLASVQPPAGLLLARRVIDFCLIFEGLLCALQPRAKCSPSRKKRRRRRWSRVFQSLHETCGAGRPGGELAQGFIYVNCPPLFPAPHFTKLPCGTPVKHLMCSVYQARVPALRFLACDLWVETGLASLSASLPCLVQEIQPRILSDGVQDQTPATPLQEPTVPLSEAPQSHGFHFIHRELRHKLVDMGAN